jgi:hypothetical protein
MSSSTAEARQAVLRRAEDQWDKAEGQKMQKRAEIYVKVGGTGTRTTSLYNKLVDALVVRVRKEEFLNSSHTAKIKLVCWFQSSCRYLPVTLTINSAQQ